MSMVTTRAGQRANSPTYRIFLALILVCSVVPSALAGAPAEADEQRFDEARPRTTAELRVEDRLASHAARAYEVKVRAAEENSDHRLWRPGRSDEIDVFARAWMDHVISDCDGDLSDCPVDPSEWLCCNSGTSHTVAVLRFSTANEELTPGQLDQLADLARGRQAGSIDASSTPWDYGVGVHVAPPVRQDEGRFGQHVAMAFVARYVTQGDPPPHPETYPGLEVLPPEDGVPLTDVPTFGLPSCRSTFVDVATWSTLGGATCRLSGIARGYSDGSFRPPAPVTRAQMASFVARTIEDSGFDLPEAEPEYADPLPPAHAPAIGALSEAGVVSGYSDGTFRPDEVVSRAQMAAFLVRAAELVLDAELRTPESASFRDVDGSAHADAIYKLVGAGVTKGVAPERYAPEEEVTRGQMAIFLWRWLFVIDVPPISDGSERSA